MRRWFSFLVVAVLLATLGAPGVNAGAQSTPGLAEARAAAQQAAQEFADAQAALGELAADLELLEARRSEAEAELEAMADQVALVIVNQYMHAGTQAPLGLSDDPNEQAKADALADIVRQSDGDTIEEFRAAEARRAAAAAEIEDLLEEQEALISDLERAQADLETQVAQLEELERQRLEEERRRAEERARREAEAAAAAEAEAAARAEREAREQAAADEARQAAEQAATTTTTVPPGDGSTTSAAPTSSSPPTSAAPTPAAPSSSSAPSAPPPPPPPPPPAPSGGGLVCPVPGSTFIDSFGAPRPQGWAHKGVDMMASTGTPIVAPVGGTVTHRGNAVGGLAFHLNGNDGRYYYGAHLSAYGQAGTVSAGTVIGYVGNTGDAIHTPPHLHLEIHIGGVAVNPYPYVRAAC